MAIVGLDHIQIAIPQGGENQARAFYCELLGFQEVPKPAVLAGRGGAWFSAAGVNLHLGVEEPFRPALKAHPAFLLDDLFATCDALTAAGYEVLENKKLSGYERRFTSDPFGNRIELMERQG